MAEPQPQNTPPGRGPVLSSNSISDIDIDLKLEVAGTFLLVCCIFFPYIGETPLRAVAGLLLGLFVPGYALSVVLFPRISTARGVPRIALSCGLSLVVTPFLAVIVNSSPWGITLPSLAFSISAFTLASVTLAAFRRQHLPSTERPINTFLLKGDNSLYRRFFFSQNRFNKTLSLVLVGLIIASAAGLIAYGAIGNSSFNQNYTQLYLLDTNGRTINYPLNYSLGESKPVVVGITNHESSNVQYKLVLMQNNSSSSQQLYSQTLTLADNSTWQQVINIKPTAKGEFKMEFSLFKGNNTAQPYREVYLWANVT